MIFNMRMFESERPFAVVRSIGYDSILRHSHEFIELIYVESGTGIQKIGETEVPLASGDLLIISGEETHSIRPTCEEQDFCIINVIFERSVIDGLDLSSFSPSEPIKINGSSALAQMIYEIKNEYEQRLDNFDIAIPAMLRLLLVKLIRLSGSRSSLKNMSIVNNAYYVDVAVKYIQKNYSEKLGLDEIASAVGLSKAYLQKIFRSERRTTIIEYLLRYRIEQACKLLIESDDTINQISNKVGFSDIKNFYGMFKRYMNSTPKDYKKMHS